MLEVQDDVDEPRVDPRSFIENMAEVSGSKSRRVRDKSKKDAEDKRKRTRKQPRKEKEGVTSGDDHSEHEEETPADREMINDGELDYEEGFIPDADEQSMHLNSAEKQDEAPPRAKRRRVQKAAGVEESRPIVHERRTRVQTEKAAEIADKVQKGKRGGKTAQGKGIQDSLK